MGIRHVYPEKELVVIPDVNLKPQVIALLSLISCLLTV